MARKPCPNANELCPYYGMEPPAELRGKQSNGCYSDRHHVVWRCLAKGALEQYFASLPQNIQQVCRWSHDEIHAADPPEIPPAEIMRPQVEVAYKLGQISIPETQANKLFAKEFK
jgi:hypothetical protein